jgi:hypothetical protein
LCFVGWPLSSVIRHVNPAESRDSVDLKVLKLMPKYGLETLYISTRGGNMRMTMMYMFIVNVRLDVTNMDSARTCAALMTEKEKRQDVSLCIEQSA